MTESIHWIDRSVTIDRSFLDEVPLIPEKMVQGITDPMLGSAVDKLFEYENPGPWAYFAPFPEYSNSVRRLFKRKVLATFDIEDAKQTLDNFLEDQENDEGDKIYSMLDELTNLNSILEEISNKILSCLKP